MELLVLVLVAASVTMGILRPRWSTLLSALVPTALAYAWLVMHEDDPGDALGLADLAWYAGMSLMVGAASALAITVGVLTARAARHTA